MILVAGPPGAVKKCLGTATTGRPIADSNRLKAPADGSPRFFHSPPGSGKSTLYPLTIFGVPYFNADDRAAALNGGSYAGISREIRQVVNREFEAFVLASIEKRVSFAIETTLRSEVTFDQAQLAKQAGFVVEMRYLALRDFEMHVERVKA